MKSSTRVSTRGRNDKGSATIEMLGILPIAILVAGAIIQVFLIGYAAVSAESTARSAARQASRGGSFVAPASGSFGGSDGIFNPQVSVSSGDSSRGGEEPSVPGGGGRDAVTATATMTVPFLGFGVDGLDLEITRFAVFPMAKDDR